MIPTKEERYKLIQGDCLEKLKELPDNSVDAVVTDPPAGISFLGRSWDTFDKNMFGIKGNEGIKDLKNVKNFEILPRYSNGDLLGFQEFIYEVMKECYRVLKPGGHCLVWAIPRTSHHTAMGVERAGFEIRDVVHHIFNTGFPKSFNIAKAIESRETTGSMNKTQFKHLDGEKTKVQLGFNKTNQEQGNRPNNYNGQETVLNPTFHSELAKEWNGFGSAIKPACEHWVLGRKSLSENTIVDNVIKWGTGGLNIDGCRIPIQQDDIPKAGNRTATFGTQETISGGDGSGGYEHNSLGRFPANVIVENDALNDGELTKAQGHWSKTKTTGFGKFGNGSSEYYGVGDKDNTYGSKSRYFDIDLWSKKNGILQIAKPSKDEKNDGCDDLPIKQMDWSDRIKNGDGKFMGTDTFSEGEPNMKNHHPTVKSITLMSWLVQLISKPNDVVLDPFMGSGSTGVASINLNRRFIGIEKEDEYMPIAEARMKAKYEAVVEEEKQKIAGDIFNYI